MNITENMIVSILPADQIQIGVRPFVAQTSSAITRAIKV
jgi:hypothetical protein